MNHDFATIELDVAGRVIAFDDAAELAFGRSDLRGEHWTKLYRTQDAWKCIAMLEASARGDHVEDDAWLLRSDGTTFFSNVIITSVRSGETLVGYEAHFRSRAHFALLERLQALTALLAAARTPDDLATVLVREGTQMFGATTGLFLRPRDAKNLELVVAFGADDALADALRHLRVDANIPAATAFRDGAAQWVESVEDYVRRAPDFPESVPLAASVAALPLKLAGSATAVMAFRFDQVRRFAPEERSLMENFAAQAAQALDRAEVYEREVKAHHRVAALERLAEALSKTITMQDVASVVIDHGMAAAKADTCTLYALDDRGEVLELVAEKGCSPDLIERIRRISKHSNSPVFRTMQSRTPVWAETHESYVAFDASLAKLEAARANAFWSMPLIAEDTPIGVLGMGFYSPRRFSDDEHAFVATFAHQCAEALLRARRFESERSARTLAENIQASLETTLRSIGDAVIATDATGIITFMNPEAERLTKWSEDQAQGKPLTDVFRIVNEHTRETVQSPVEKVLALGATVGLANHTVLIARDGTEVPIDDSGAPIRRVDDRIDGVVLVFRDVTEKKEEESHQKFLEEATALLAESSLDYEATLAKVARLTVPRLADWCALDIVDLPGEAPKRLAVAHIDPAKIDLAKEIEAKYPTPRDAPTGVPNVLRTGRAELYPAIPEELILAGCVDDEHRRLAMALSLRSAMVVPLLVRERVLGALTFVFAESGRNYDEADLRFAEDLAHRCAVAIDNARLFASELSARKSADIANRSKDEFLAMVSHELRTPLNAIMGWAKLLMMPEFDAANQSNAIATIERNAVAMAQLIEDLLDISRIISGKMRLEVQRIDFSRAIRGAIDSVKPAADAKNIEIESTLETASIMGDATRLQQIAWNLLSNAVKFTPKGGRVNVKLANIDSWTELVVSDSGKGIGATFLPYVFDSFRQEDASQSRSRGGLGLGLAISRQLVELHGGNIEVQSEGEGHGATFVVRLPPASAATELQIKKMERRASERPTFERPPQLRDLRVLVVDDEEDARRLVGEILSQCGCRVTLAGSVDSALAEISREVPDVVVSDIGMPEKDGYELIRQLRARPPDGGGNVPAAALTAYVRAEDRRAMLNAGFSMHIGKPVEPAELVAVVASLTRFASRRTS